MSPHEAETVDLSIDGEAAQLQPGDLVSELRGVISRQAIAHRLPIDERLAGVLAREMAQVIVSLIEERGGLSVV